MINWMPDDLFSILDNITTTTKTHKRKLYSKIEKIIIEEQKWTEIKIKQMQEENEREENDRLAKEAFDIENEEIAKRKRKKVFMSRRRAKRRKHKVIRIQIELRAGRKRKKREAKSDAELVIEISTKETPEALGKWLYRNLSIALAPRKPDDPDWNKKNVLLQEIIACRNDLKKLKKIAEIHRPEWVYFFRC